MKKVLLLVAIIIFVLCSCDSQDTASVYPTLNKTELNLSVGQAETLKVLNADNIEWNSSNPNVARVFYGAVTALAEGNAIITADVGNTILECTVTVLKSDTNTKKENPEESVQETAASSNPSSPQDTTVKENSVNSQNEQSQPTYEENVAATQEAAFKLVERLTDEKYDKAIADLTKECNDILAGYKKDIAEKQARLEIVGEKTAEGFMLKDSIKILNESISNTKKILKEGIESLERQREDEHTKNKEEFEAN